MPSSQLARRVRPRDAELVSGAAERARAARLLGCVASAEWLVSELGGRDSGAISVPPWQRTPRSPPPPLRAALLSASRAPHGASPSTAATRQPCAPPPGSWQQASARTPDVALAHAAAAAYAAEGGGPLAVTPGGSPKRPLQASLAEFVLGMREAMP